MAAVTKTDIQIRFADVDILGHVNNVNMQHYFDLGKMNYYGEVLGLHGINNTAGIITASTHTQYLAQTRPDDKIYVETQVESVGTKSLVFFQRIISHISGEVHADSRSVMVAYDFVNQTSIPVLDKWRKAML